MNTIIDYREILKNELAARKSKNIGYSMRAFARDIGLTSSRLSLILQNKQGLSTRRATMIADKLELTLEKKNFFCTLVEAQDARSKEKRLQAVQKLFEIKQYKQVYKQLDEDKFYLISDWYHFALLELAKTKTFKNNVTWIAKRLNISVIEVEQAIKRLIRLDLLRFDKNKILPTNKSLMTTDGVPSQAIKKFNKQILTKAIDAVDYQSVDERFISTITFAVSKSQLSYLKDELTQLRKKLNKAVEAQNQVEQPEEVYNLSFSLIKLTEHSHEE